MFMAAEYNLNKYSREFLDGKTLSPVKPSSAQSPMSSLAKRSLVRVYGEQICSTGILDKVTSHPSLIQTFYF